MWFLRVLLTRRSHSKVDTLFLCWLADLKAILIGLISSLLAWAIVENHRVD